MPDKDLEQLKMLNDYTKIHIGTFTALVAAIVALMSRDPKNWSPPPAAAMKITAVLFCLAARLAASSRATHRRIRVLRYSGKTG